MSRRRKINADGSPVPRSRRTPRPPPSAEALEAFEAFTDTLPEPLRAFREFNLLSPTRRLVIEQVLETRTRSLCLVLYGLHDPHNQAAVIRTSEAMGFQEIHFITVPGAPFKPSERVTQSAHRWVDLVFHQDFEAAAASLRKRGKRILAAALVEGAMPLHEVDTVRPTALVLGREAKGLPQEVVAACDGAFSIPMYGLTTSLNVSAAAAIVAAHAVEVRRRAWGGPGDLLPEEKMALRRRFYSRAAGKVPPSLQARLDMEGAAEAE